MGLSDRLAKLERHALATRPHVTLTNDHWQLLAKRDAAIIVHWLGGVAGDIWTRLYRGIAAGNASGDTASPLRYPLKRRFDWAASQGAGRAATGRPNTREAEAWALIDPEQKRTLFGELAPLCDKHPELVGPEVGSPPIWRIDADGNVTDAGEIIHGIPLLAFGIHAARSSLAGRPA